MRKIKDTLIVLCVLWSLVLLPTQALAQMASLVCDTATGGVTSGEIYDTGGPSHNAGVCQYQGIKHIFSQVICQFVVVINDVLGKVYCGMQLTLMTIVSAVISLYVAAFGIQMLLGMTELSAKEFMTRIFKIAIIWVFISQSTWGISIAFSFFVSLANEGIVWVMSAINTALPPNTTNTTCYDAAAGAATGAMNAFTHLDDIICNAVTGPFTKANNKVIGFFIALSLAFWPIGYLILSWLWLNFKVMVGGLITFLLGIAAIAFLIAMSPIFLSLMLFKITYQFFETWLKFLISFSLQVILVFACIALWMIATSYFIYFFNDIEKTIFPHQNDRITSSVHGAGDSWGVCPFNYYPTDPNTSTTPRPGPYVACQKGGFNPAANATDKDAVLSVSTLLMSETNTPSGSGPIPPVCLDTTTAGSNMNDCAKYFYYVVYHLITLIIVCYAFEALLREAPKIAQYLAGPEYVPLIGQGFGVNRSGNIRSLLSSPNQSATQNNSAGQPKSFLSSLFGGGSDAPNNAQAARGGTSTGSSSTPAQTYNQRARDQVGVRPDSSPG